MTPDAEMIRDAAMFRYLMGLPAVALVPYAEEIAKAEPDERRTVVAGLMKADRIPLCGS